MEKIWVVQVLFGDEGGNYLMADKKMMHVGGIVAMNGE